MFKQFWINDVFWPIGQRQPNINTFTWYLLNFFQPPFSYMGIKAYLSIYQWQGSIFEMSWSCLSPSCSDLTFLEEGDMVSWMAVIGFSSSVRTDEAILYHAVVITPILTHAYHLALSATRPSGSLWDPPMFTVWTCVGECEPAYLRPHLYVDFRLTENQAYAQDEASHSPRHIFCD